MKLELKHLAPYLPYALEFDYYKDVWQMTDLGASGIITAIMPKNKHRVFRLSIIKPLFRPLSDLTKEIEHNGKRFIPMEVMFGWDIKEEEAFDIYGTLPDAWKAFLAVDLSKAWDYRVMILLFEWHFDVFGLIDKGLAININDLNDA